MSSLTFFKQTLKKSSFRFIKKTEPKLQQFPVYTPSPASIRHHQHPPPDGAFVSTDEPACVCVCVHMCSVVTDALRTHELQPTRLHCPWNFPGKILECVAMTFSRGSSQPRDQAQVSCTAGRFFTTGAAWEAVPAGTPYYNQRLCAVTVHSRHRFIVASQTCATVSSEEDHTE